MKLWLIRVLFKLIDIPEDKPAKEEVIDRWLAESWQHPGFMEYMKWRDKEFVKILAGGLGAAPFTREDYLRYLGQRVELQRFGKRCQKAFEKRRKEH